MEPERLGLRLISVLVTLAAPAAASFRRHGGLWPVEPAPTRDGTRFAVTAPYESSLGAGTDGVAVMKSWARHQGQLPDNLIARKKQCPCCCGMPAAGL